MSFDELTKEPMGKFLPDLPTLDKYKMSLAQFKRFCNKIVEHMKSFGTFKKVEVVFVHARIPRSTKYIDVAVIVADKTRRFWLVASRTKYVKSLPSVIKIRTVHDVHKSMFGRRSYCHGICAVEYPMYYDTQRVARQIEVQMKLHALYRVYT